MNQSNTTRYLAYLRAWMIVFGISFVITDIIFLIGQEPMFKLLNWEANLVGLPDSPVPSGNEWFFLALANSMMVMIAYLSFAVAVNPRKHFNYLPVLILSKMASSLTGLVFFFTTRCLEPVCVLQGGIDGTPYFSNLSIFLTDFPLALITLVLYHKGKSHFAQTPHAHTA